MSAQTALAHELLDTPRMSIWRRLTRVQAAQIVLVLVILCVIFSVMAPDAFPTVFNLRSIILNTSIFAVLGVGATLVVITAGIDLSIGSVLVFSSVIGAQVMGAMGAEGWGAALAGTVASIAAAITVSVGTSANTFPNPTVSTSTVGIS